MATLSAEDHRKLADELDNVGNLDATDAGLLDECAAALRAVADAQDRTAAENGGIFGSGEDLFAALRRRLPSADFVVLQNIISDVRKLARQNLIAPHVATGAEERAAGRREGIEAAALRADEIEDYAGPGIHHPGKISDAIRAMLDTTVIATEGADVGALRIRCPYDGGFDRETGPIGCMLDDGRFHGCVCRGIGMDVSHPAALKADMLRSLPGGKLDDSSYEAIEDICDRAEAPWKDGSRWLTLVERIAALEADRDAWKAKYEAAIEALTPSGATKAAYSGEFSEPTTEMVETEDGEWVERSRQVPVSWTTIKEIMAAIRDCAASLVSDHDRANSEMEKQG